METKEFKLVRKVETCEWTIVDAKSKEEALQMYNDGEANGWEQVWGSDYDEVIEVFEQDKKGEFTICHDVENCEFVK